MTFTAAAAYDVLDDRTRDLLEFRARTGTGRRRGWLVRRALVLADLIGLTSAFAVAHALYPGDSGVLNGLSEVLFFVGSLPLWVVAAKFYGLYDKDEERADHSTTDDFAGVFHLVTVCSFLLYAISLQTRWFDPQFDKLLLFWAIGCVSVTSSRVVARAYCRRQVNYLQNTIIVGAGEIGQLVARKLLQHPEYGINLVGFVDGNPRERRADIGHLAVIGGVEALPELVVTFDIERVIIAFSNEHHEEIIELIRALRHADVQIDLVPRLFEVVGPNVETHSVEGLPLIGLPPARRSQSSRVAKRILDVVGAAVGLAVMWPLFLYIALRVRRDSPGPVFFRQTRLGIGMREFTALKFRTMRVDTDDSSHREYIRQTMTSSATLNGNGIYKLDRGDAVTPVGRWLRKTSLDELPQLINVLRGQMSLVGPRPCIPYETDSFAPHHFERFLVPQGLTGLWQVTARARSTFGEALDMDVVYARGWSLGLDLALLFKTPVAILRSRGTA